ncbi:MAG: class I SAM-dependent methyltransferase [Caulobacterales bacterium]
MLIHATIQGTELRFETSEALFSPRRVDAGTLAMLQFAQIAPGDKVLDLGCGYGAVGVFAATVTAPDRVWMVDNDPAAVAFAERNLKLNAIKGAHVVLSDGLAGLRETGFDKILCNPPYHEDFSVPKRMIEKGFNRLVMGGGLWMVTRRDAWYRRKLTAVFGGVRVHPAGEYFVFEAIRKSASYASAGARPR